MNAASNDLAAVQLPVKPWAERSNSVASLAGGAENYLDTFGWILRQHDAVDGSLTSVIDSYGSHYGLKPNVSQHQIKSLSWYGFLNINGERWTPTEAALSWLRGYDAAVLIRAMHANVRFIGEMLKELESAKKREELRVVATDKFGFRWTTLHQVTYRLAWLRSAGFARLQPGNTYQATESGIALLELVDLYEPASDSDSDNGRHQPVPELPPGPTDLPSPERQEPRSSVVGTRPSSGQVPPSPKADEIAQRVVSLSCDGAKHKEFEAAVRDAFDFLGFDAQHLSGPGQTDVLLTGLRNPKDAPPGAKQPWSYRVAVDAKASSSGKLADLQVTWPALAMHRQHHEAEFSLLVGPSPRTRLLQFAKDASVAVLAADDLAELCRRHAQVPLPVADYHRLFSGDDGQPCGGRVDPARIEDPRQREVRRRELLARVADTTAEIAANFGPANQQLVRFKLGDGTSAVSGAPATGSEIDEALRLLASPWLQAAAQVGAEAADPHYVPAAPARFAAQRLRWLADAFDDATDGEAAPSAGSG